jgi:predicted nucleic acid-binding protein
MPRQKTPSGLPYAVIDNSLLSRLVDLEIAVFLPFLFKRIRIPREVRREAYKAPSKGKRRLLKLIKEMEGFFIDCAEADELIKSYLMADLDAGEAAAIAQADYTMSVLLLDEKKGYRRAQIMEIEVIRTGKLLCMLKKAGAVELVKPYLDQLELSGFHLSEEARKEILAEAGEET